MPDDDARLFLGSPDDGPLFQTPRKALGAYYAKQKGPGLTRPLDSRQDSGDSLSSHQRLRVGTILRSHGIECGGELDNAIRAWATTSENATGLWSVLPRRMMDKIDAALRDERVVISKAAKKARRVIVKHWWDSANQKMAKTTGEE